MYRKLCILAAIYREIINLRNLLIMKKIASIFARVSLFITGLLFLPAQVLAQAAWQPTEGPEADSLDELIRIGLNTAIIMAAVVAVFFLVYNGFRYMTAAGDSGKTEEAQKGIANALIGLVICIAAALIVNFVLGRLGMEAKPLDTALTFFLV